MNDRRLAALVLAAGASTRLGQPKQLLRYRGEQLVARAVRVAREAGADPVFVVVGAGSSAVSEALSATTPPARVLLNQRWSEGMGHSIGLGAAAAERDGADDLLVLTCDQIHVTPEHLRRMVEASHGDYVAASVYGGRRGVPALFPAFRFGALQLLRGDRGARDLLQHEDVLAVPLHGGEVDIDTPEDLDALQDERDAADRTCAVCSKRMSEAVTQNRNDTFTRERAWALLTEWTTSASLLKHGLAVEICTAAYGEKEAARLGLEGEAAAAYVLPYHLAGLLHDFDYDRHPSLDEHVWVGNKVLVEQGWPEPVRHAILAHADYTKMPRSSHLDRALFACDELSGFLTACALVKPSRSIQDVEVAGVRKKMKDKAFARGVLREDIVVGAELLGLSVEEHVGNCLHAMQAKADVLGLAGTDPVQTSV